MIREDVTPRKQGGEAETEGGRKGRGGGRGVDRGDCHAVSSMARERQGGGIDRDTDSDGGEDECKVAAETSIAARRATPGPARA